MKFKNGVFQCRAKVARVKRGAGQNYTCTQQFLGKHFLEMEMERNERKKNILEFTTNCYQLARDVIIAFYNTGACWRAFRGKKLASHREQKKRAQSNMAMSGPRHVCIIIDK